VKLKLKDLKFSYNSHPFLEDITLEVDSGEILGLLGPNGSGKTTILKCINKILNPDKGEVFISNRNLKSIGLREMATFLSYVPQSTHSSFALTVFEMVLLGRRPYVRWKISEYDEEIVFKMLKLVKLDSMAFRIFSELSGGEKQKVLLARALCQEPKILLLDEPTSNLDLKHQFEILKLIESMVRDKGLSVVMAIHDLNLALRFSDKIALLKDGRIYAAGDVNKILNEENIKKVFGVETIINNYLGKPYIITLASD
jgi:iron complex transport system ATP-binding protein